MKRRDFMAGLACATGWMLPSVARSQADQASLVAWVGASIWTGDGQLLENATLVTRGERVAVVGPSGVAPAAARSVDARGHVITPGWIATETALGLVEVAFESSTVDSRPRGDAKDAIRPGHAAADGYNPRSVLIGVARQEGVTSAVSTPDGGLIAGTSAWVDLLDEFPGTALVREHVAVHSNLFEYAQASRPAALARLREVLDGARIYARSPDAYDRGETRRLKLSRRDLERLAEVRAGTLPLVVRVARGSDMLRLLELAEAAKLRVIFSGAEEAWTVAPALARAGVPVIVDPTDRLPETFSSLRARPDNAALLSAAGVSVVISTFDAHAAYNLRHLAGNAVASGLSRGAALGSLTSAPARAFGMDSDYGTLAPGRIANFSVWNGDPFELGTWAREVVVRGRPVRVRSRQTELFERYRNLGNVPKGRAGLGGVVP